MSMRMFLAAGLGLALLASTAAAGPENVKWPADYKTAFTNTFNGDRTANEKQVIRVFANDMALQGAATDGKLPFGSVLVAELYAAKLDADGSVIESTLGRRIIDKLSAIVVMERGEGFDAEYPDDLKVGDWEFAVFSPSGKRLDKDITGCRECHHPLTEMEYVFSYEHLLR